MLQFRSAMRRKALLYHGVKEGVGEEADPEENRSGTYLLAGGVGGAAPGAPPRGQADSPPAVLAVYADRSGRHFGERSNEDCRPLADGGRPIRGSHNSADSGSYGE